MWNITLNIDVPEHMIRGRSRSNQKEFIDYILSIIRSSFDFRVRITHDVQYWPDRPDPRATLEDYNYKTVSIPDQIGGDIKTFHATKENWDRLDIDFVNEFERMYLNTWKVNEEDEQKVLKEIQENREYLKELKTLLKEENLLPRDFIEKKEMEL